MGCEAYSIAFGFVVSSDFLRSVQGGIVVGKAFFKISSKSGRLKRFGIPFFGNCIFKKTTIAKSR